MTFKDHMAEDLTNVMNADEFDEPGEFYPTREGTSHFTVRAIRGDITTGASTFDQGTEHTRTCEVILIRSVVRAGILAIEAAERDPRRGDRLTFTDDDDATAEWVVAAVGAIDVGGGVSVSLEHVSYGNPGSGAANEVR